MSVGFNMATLGSMAAFLQGTLFAACPVGVAAGLLLFIVVGGVMLKNHQPQALQAAGIDKSKPSLTGLFGAAKGLVTAVTEAADKLNGANALSEARRDVAARK